MSHPTYKTKMDNSAATNNNPLTESLTKLDRDKAGPEAFEPSAYGLRVYPVV